MSVPVFEEFEPEADCGCAGCAGQRRARALGVPVRAGGHPAAHGVRRALVLVTATGAVLGTGGVGPAGATRTADGVGGVSGAAVEATGSRVSAPGIGVGGIGVTDHEAEPENPQGGQEPLRAVSGRGPVSATPVSAPAALPAAAPRGPVPALRATTRADIVRRAEKWVTARVPYDMNRYWGDGYRQDCSGYVSMVWNLPSNEWTGSLTRFADRISRADLQPGDILLFHNPAGPTRGSHVTVFGGWTDSTRTSYTAYEQTKPYTRTRTTPMAYWQDSEHYVAYRYKGLTGAPSVQGGGAGGGTGSAATPYPGAAKFGPGADNAYVTRLGKLLVARGGKSFYRQGPGPRWGEADRRATEAFQRAQGWKGGAADGLPGPRTWSLLVTGQGKDIGGAGGSGGSSGSSGSATAFPGRGSFRPGQSHAYVEKLGKQLVKRGFGKHYTSGPGPRWTEADRRNVESFQRAQGWRGSAADGYPGPETWRRLFR
ncbi:peptidoglycan-binding protein [Streptomyces sp. NPDC048718]|uniref:peptidoglycan-binding protein n=1 Tax=Streptomyces sp. NPDC048718 TaxID=3365587 RepID=UPI00371E4454